MTARTIARYVAVALMGIGVLVATADGFAQSYSGLYGWALEHSLTGWKAQSFPLLVDTFVGVGELGMFLLAIDGHKLRKSLLSWLDLLMPGSVAAAGWGASLIFNVGHVEGAGFATQATAAVPPLASMIGLVVLLRTLHRYVTQAPAAVDVTPIALSVPPEDLALDPLEDDTPPELLAWLKGEDVPAVPAPDPHHVAAVDAFGEQVRAGRVPGVREIKKRLRIGQPKAQEVREYLALLTAK